MGSGERQHATSLDGSARSTASSTLGGLGLLLREFSDPLVVMRRITDEALLLIDMAEGAAVELVDGDGLRCVCGVGTLSGLVGTILSMDGSLSGRAIQCGTTLRCDDAGVDPRVDGDAALRTSTVSVVCVPLRCEDRLVGALNVASTSRFAFSDGDVSTLARLSAFMTAMITAASDLNAATDELLSAAGAPEADALPDTVRMSAFVANVLRPGILDDLRSAQNVERILTHRLFHVVFQPIIDVADGRVVIAEALSRFTPTPYRSPDIWFADAWRAGFGAELELAALRAAAEDLGRLPDGVRMAVNLSPQVITHPKLASFFKSTNGDRFVVELTEHVPVDDYNRVRRALMSLRERGVRLAIDDTGAGFASLSHIIKLSPDIIKLDRELIHGIDADPVRRSLGTAIVTFAGDIGADVVAEGVETRQELDAIRALGIGYAQGMLLGAPGAVDTSVNPSMAPHRGITERVVDVRHRRRPPTGRRTAS
jgi:EAL domain-containing protein (putative c-di-GMP-specific phosphodiesterase class I)